MVMFVNGAWGPGYVAAKPTTQSSITPKKRLSNALPPAVNYTPSAQWLQQLAQAQQGGQFNGLLNGLNMSPTRVAAKPGQASYSPNAQALSAQFLK